ncbi:hypothetical protein ACIQXD_09530 [Streptomyces uncialis]|uniref:hypothetical protein n=1 Tax=Streptomyces uncialis TaxID=1048205 RepID=UPI00382D73B4
MREEPAVMLGGRPGTVRVRDPPAFNALVAAAGTAWRLPDLARLGARAGWASAFETGDGPHRADRDHLRGRRFSGTGPYVPVPVRP